MSDNIEKDKPTTTQHETVNDAAMAAVSNQALGPRSKLQSCNWLSDVPGDFNDADDIIEVAFKNTRRGFYRNSQHLQLAIGDLVAVEASPGHDIERV